MKNVWITRAQTVLTLMIIFFLLLSCSKDETEEHVSETEGKEIIADKDLVDGSYIVIVSKEPAAKNSKAATYLGQLTSEINKKPGASVNHTYKHALTGFAAKLTNKQVQELAKDPRVEHIEQDHYFYLDNTATAVQEYANWGLDRLDQREGRLDRAYAYTGTGKGVTVYVMDTGLRESHEEFGDRASFGYDFTVDAENDDPELEPGEDCYGHGTPVAGIIGGLEYGVAKEVNLVNVKVFTCKGGAAASTIVAAVDWVTNNAARPAIVNASFGYPSTETAVATAVANSIETGIHYAVSAGNSNSDACQHSPAAVTTAITVGATNISSEKAYFSSYGDCVDIYAPGLNTTTASQLDDSSSRLFSGTSAAAPYIAGVMALYLENNLKATPAEVHAALLENSTPNAVSDVPSGPANMVYSLWEPVEFSPPTPPDLNLKAYGFKEGSNSTVHLSWEPTEDPIMHIYRNGKYFSRWYNDGRYKLQVKGKGNDRFMICEENYINCSEEVVANFDDTGDFEPNISPVPSFTYSVDDLQVQFTDTSTDEDGTIISWTWYFGDGSNSVQQNPIHTYSEPGTYRIEFMIQDNYHDLQYVIENITVGDVNANKPPRADFNFNTNLLEVKFTDSSSDADGSVTSWSWNFGDGNTSSTKDPVHSYSEAGSYEVELTVTDDSGDTGNTVKNVVVSTEETAPEGIVLSGTGYKVKGEWHADLSWDYTGMVDIYRDGTLVASIDGSSGTYTDASGKKGGGSLKYKICEAGSTANCSNEITLQF